MSENKIGNLKLSDAYSLGGFYTLQDQIQRFNNYTNYYKEINYFNFCKIYRIYIKVYHDKKYRITCIK